MTLVVPDASALVEYLLRTPRAVSIEDVLTATESDLHVPALCDVEVCSALRKLLLEGRMAEKRAEEALADYLDLPLTRHGHAQLLEHVLRLGKNFSAYDATYVVLAASLGSIFVTCDGRLARAVRDFFPDLHVRT